MTAEIHHDDAVDEVHDEIHVVLDDEDRQPLRAQRAQQLGERELFRAAQARGGFVEHQQDRIGDQRARDLEHALLAEREIAGEFERALAEADALELTHAPRSARCAPPRD